MTRGTYIRFCLRLLFLLSTPSVAPLLFRGHHCPLSRSTFVVSYILEFPPFSSSEFKHKCNNILQGLKQIEINHFFDNTCAMVSLVSLLFVEIRGYRSCDRASGVPITEILVHGHRPPIKLLLISLPKFFFSVHGRFPFRAFQAWRSARNKGHGGRTDR